MIPIELEEMFFEDQDGLMIPAQDVAVLRTEHPLYHAMLMLSTSFNKLPVLDDANHVQGALTTSTIIKAAATNTGYELERLADLKVKDILEEKIGFVHYRADMEDILRELQDSNFICVVDDEQVFMGIITRKEVMARINRCFHTLNRSYDLVAKGHNSEERKSIEAHHRNYPKDSGRYFRKFVAEAQ